MPVTPIPNQVETQTPEIAIAESANPLSGLSWPALLLILWIAGSAAVLLRRAMGSLGLLWLRRKSQPVVDPDWRDLAEIVEAELGMTRPVSLRQFQGAIMPMTWGRFSPGGVASRNG